MIGTYGGDTMRLIAVKESKSDHDRDRVTQAIEVIINGKSFGTYKPTWRIIGYARGGNDDIEVTDSIKLEAELSGDNG